MEQYGAGDTYGELGSKTGKISEPTNLQVGASIIDVATGRYHTLMVTTDGKVLGMGYNNYGQLGNNKTSSSKVPVTIQIQAKDEEGNIVYKDLEGIVKVAAYDDMSLALDENGNVYIILLFVGPSLRGYTEQRFEKAGLKVIWEN